MLLFSNNKFDSIIFFSVDKMENKAPTKQSEPPPPYYPYEPTNNADDSSNVRAPQQPIPTLVTTSAPPVIVQGKLYLLYTMASVVFRSNDSNCYSRRTVVSFLSGEE